MEILGFSFFIMYNIFLLCYFRKIFIKKRSTIISYSIAIIVNILTVKLAWILFDQRYIIYFMMISMMISVYVLFYVTKVQLLFAGIFYTFSLYSSTGIVFSVYSIVLNTTIQNVLINQSDSIFMWAVIVSIGMSCVFNKIITPDSMERHLLNNREQLKFVVIYMFIQMIFITLINDGRFRSVNQLWFSYLYLISCIISKLGLIFVINHTAKVSKLLEYEIYTQQLKKQLSSQIRHYNSYRKFTDSYREFKHDYQKLMNSIRILINNHEYEKVLKMLEDIDEGANREIFVHKTYSNNVLLDAVFQDTADICVGKQILFSADVNFPKNIALSEIDTVKVFANLMDNAIEACDKIDYKKKYIDVKSMRTNEWIIVEIENSFDGKLKKENGQLKTTKINQAFHGLGLRIVMETIENLGGLVSIEPNHNNKIFKIRLCIPTA